MAEIADLGDPSILLRRDVVEPREHRRERDVDPDVDRAEFGLDPLGGRFDLVRVGDVGRDRQRDSTERDDLGGRRCEPDLSPGEQGDVGTTTGEGTRDGSAIPPLAPVMTTISAVFAVPPD